MEIVAIAIGLAIFAFVMYLQGKPRFNDKMDAGKWNYPLINYASEWHITQGYITLGEIHTDVTITDTSFWQRTIDYVKMLTAGAKGTILRAGQGSWRDNMFAENWEKARRKSIPRGSYWFYDSRVHPKQQAQLWATVLNGDFGELPHFADYEENYGGQYAGFVHFKIFLEEFLRLTQLPDSRVGIYTGYYYWIANSPSNNTELAYFKRFWLWISWYTTTPESVQIPAPWTRDRVLLWQNTSSGDGRRFGVSSEEIDLNFFVFGDLTTYNTMFGLHLEPEPTTGDTMIYNLTVIAAFLNGRDAPSGNVNFPAGSVLPTGFRSGDKLQAVEVREGWYRITVCNRNGSFVVLPSPVWAYAGATMGLMSVDSITNPVPVPSVNPRVSFSMTDSSGKVFEAINIELLPK